MTNSMFNNFIFFLDGDLGPSGVSVPISVDVENKDVVEIATPADATMIAEDGSQVERFYITATGGIMTITKRGIKNDASGDSDNALKKQWYAGQKVFVTVHAAHVITGSANNLFSGDNTFSGTTTFTGIVNLSALGDLNVLGKSNPWAVVANTAARDALYPTPSDGDHIRIANTKDQVYNGGTAQWEDYDIGTPPPNASETAKGLAQQATLANQGTMTEIGSSGAPLFMNPKNFKKASGTIYTSAFLTGGTNATSVVATWQAVTNGSFRITIDSVQRDITGLDFSTDTTMDLIATRIQAAIRAITSGLETVIWSTNKFIISSGDVTSSSAITVTSAVGSGTDISGAGATDFMDCDTGHGVVTAAVSNPAADENYGLLIGPGGKIDTNFLPNSLMSPSMLLGENMTALDIATIGIDSNLYKYSGVLSGSGSFSTSGNTPVGNYFMLDTNKVCVTYVADGGTGNYYGYAVIGTITNNSISWGTPVNVYNSAGLNSCTILGCKLATDKIAIALYYYTGSASSSDVISVVGTVSGTTISFGTAVGLKTSNYTDSLQDIIKVGTDKYVVKGQWDNNFQVMCCSVSGTTITKGTTLIAGNSASKLCYVSDDVFIEFLTNTIYRYTISGTTITAGSNLSLGEHWTSPIMLYLSSTQQIVSGLNGGNLKAVVLNGTPSTPTKGTICTVKATVDTNCGLALCGTSILYFNCGSSGSNEYSVLGSISGTIISPNSQLQITSTTPISSSGIICTGRYFLNFTSSNPTFTYRFYTHEYNSIVGFLESTGTLGQSKSISTKGKVLDGFVGLVPGYKYFVASDFTLKPDSSSGVGYGKEMGVALTTTKLLITA